MDTTTVPSDGMYLTSRCDVTTLIETLKAETGVHRIVAFSGSSDNGLTEDAPADLAACLDARMEREIAAAMRYLAGFNAAILTGGTVWGVPAVAARAAKLAGLVTIGVFPRSGAKYALPPDVLDLRICVEPRYGDSCWGDESALYAKILDGVIVYGGNAGTLVEVAHLLKLNESRVKYGERPKFIVPVSGSGGTADALPFFPAKVKVRAACMPCVAATALDAARELAMRLDLFDYPRLTGDA